MNIILIGYRCTGKSTVGKKLADKLNLTFCDTDSLIEEQAKMPIIKIVEKDGWETFRSKEKKIIQELSLTNERIISTGGGAIEDPENIECLTGNGIFIWLTADIKTIVARMHKDSKTENLRPSFSRDDLYQETTIMLKRRTPIYQKLAHLTINTSQRNIDEIIHEICAYLSGFQHSKVNGQF